MSQSPLQWGMILWLRSNSVLVKALFWGQQHQYCRELARSAKSQAPCQTHWIGISGSRAQESVGKSTRSCFSQWNRSRMETQVAQWFWGVVFFFLLLIGQQVHRIELIIPGSTWKLSSFLYEGPYLFYFVSLFLSISLPSLSPTPSPSPSLVRNRHIHVYIFWSVSYLFHSTLF